MSRGRFEPNKRGIDALLRDPGLRADLLARATRVAAAANEGADGDQGDFVAAVSSQRGKRPRVVVVATDQFANRRQARHNVLGRAIDLGRTRG